MSCLPSPVLVVLAVIAVVLGHQVLASWSSTAGAVPDRATVFDDELPAVANLDPALLDALRDAAARCRGRRGRAPRQQRLAFSGVPGTAAP